MCWTLAITGALHKGKDIVDQEYLLKLASVRTGEVVLMFFGSGSMAIILKQLV